MRSGKICRELSRESASATLVWLHGLGESGFCFEPLLQSEALASYSHLAPDLLGYGRSPWPLHPLSLEDHATDVLSFLEAEVRGPFVLLGHSMGGVIGQMVCELATQRSALPDLVGFINIEGNLSLGDCTTSRWVEPYSEAEFESRGIASVRQRIFDQAAKLPASRSYFVSVCLCQPSTFRRNAAQLVELSRAEGLARRFGALTVNKAFVHGSPGGAPERSAQLLRKVGVEPQVISEAGHWPYIDQRTAFLELVAKILDGWL